MFFVLFGGQSTEICELGQTLVLDAIYGYIFNDMFLVVELLKKVCLSLRLKLHSKDLFHQVITWCFAGF